MGEDGGGGRSGWGQKYHPKRSLCNNDSGVNDSAATSIKRSRAALTGAQFSPQTRENDSDFLHSGLQTLRAQRFSTTRRVSLNDDILVIYIFTFSTVNIHENSNRFFFFHFWLSDVKI